MRNTRICLWFDNKAEEAAKFYTSIFKNSKIETTTHYGKSASQASGQLEGSIFTVFFKLEGAEFLAVNGGPMFKPTPIVSFFVSCDTEKEVDDLCAALLEGGSALMELGKYPWSERYAWVTDRFGFSWQLNFASREQKIAPSLMFTGANAGRATEAINFYTSVFPKSKVLMKANYEKGEPGPETSLKHARFSLNGSEFVALDSHMPHGFEFSEAISIMVDCDTQKEIDEYWQKLTSDGGEPSQCGWLKDKFGVSWQIVPTVLDNMMREDGTKSERVMEALVEMTKLEIEPLQKAFNR